MNCCFKSWCALLVLYLSTSPIYAAPFDSCPARAFLSQNTHAHLYDVNLITGHYTLLSNEMGAERINGIGFSSHDRYFYAWSYQHGVLARIGNDYQITPLAMSNIANTNFFVGDVSVEENAHYVYRRGANFGLYRIELDPDSPTYLDMTRIVDGAKMNLRIFDMAFHPSNGSAYAVDSGGLLWRIEVDSGAVTNIADMGETGTFGASYFDVSGQFYFSRNSDGHIFKVDIDSADLTPQLFAYGPSSSTNDGARCALADVVDVAAANIDYGDAPDSYQTSLANNGPRHEVPDPLVLFLGSGVDGESDGSPYPLSDDDDDNSDDEDGVSFPTGIIKGATSLLLIDSSAQGFFNAWLDTDHSGVFDSSDHLVQDRIVYAGTNVVAMTVPESSDSGTTWARFRLSSQANLQPFGGAPDGEVEDAIVSINSIHESTTWYPSQSAYTTVAFEDNWPVIGDYDMNDLVVYLRTGVIRELEQITAVIVEGQIAAVGAAYHNGFAVRLPGIDRSLIDENGIAFSINGNTFQGNVLDELASDATFIIVADTYDYVSPGEGCEFYRTELNCGGDIEMSFQLFVPLATPIHADLSGVFDPFLFATPGEWHGDWIASPPGRSYEVHLKNYAPTEAVDVSLFGREADASSPAEGLFYQNENGMPWALEIPMTWQYPREYQDLLSAYPQFEAFVESQGTENTQWFLPANGNPEYIFQYENEDQ